MKEGAADVLAHCSWSLGQVLLVSSLTLSIRVRIFGSVCFSKAGIFQISSLGSIMHPGIGLVFHYRNRWLETSI